MIYVIATVDCKKGCREDYLSVLRRNIPNVRAEKGCVKYEPTIDVDSGIGMQGALREDVVTLIEAWEDLEALQKHLKMPHMLAYREATKDFVNRVTIQVLTPA